MPQVYFLGFISTHNAYKTGQFDLGFEAAFGERLRPHQTEGRKIAHANDSYGQANGG